MDDRTPFVSILVPIYEDGDEGKLRLHSAQSQTWAHTEVIQIHIAKQHWSDEGIWLPGGTLTDAVKAGAAASRGQYISLLLPGAIYAPVKVAAQIAFMRRMELSDAVLFCNYFERPTDGSAFRMVSLPSIDPSQVLERLYCGMRIDPSSLLIPRSSLEQFGASRNNPIELAVLEWCMSLCKQTPFVGMAEALLTITGSPSTGGSRRSIYKDALSQVLCDARREAAPNRPFAVLGEAAAARLAECQPLAAVDTLAASCKELASCDNKRQALIVFADRFARRGYRALPPAVRKGIRALAGRRFTVDQMRNRLDFSDIYRNNGFVGTESRSGVGSTLFQTRVVRQQLPVLLRELSVRSVLDIPCGDFHWMRDVDLEHMHYIGADVVEDLIRANQKHFGGAARKFEVVDLISGPLPEADLIFCRDCLVHLPFADVNAALDTVRNSRSTWLLTTTFTECEANSELDGAGWRALNLERPPFNLPPPERIILERCTEAGGAAADKALGLWRIDTLRKTVGVT